MGLARIARQRGHEARVFYGRGAPPAGQPADRIQGPLGLYAHVLKARVLDRQGFGSAAATKGLVKELEAWAPDVIHLHNLHGYWLHIPTLFAYLKGCKQPVIWTLHDCWPFTGRCAYFDAAGCEKWRLGCGGCPQKNAYPKSVLLDQSQRNFSEKKRLFLGVEDLTLATPSRWLMELAKESFFGKSDPPAKFAVLPNGVDQSIFAPVKSDLRARYGLEGKRVLLGVANIWEPRKGLTTFFELRKILSKDYAIVLIGLDQKQLSAVLPGILAFSRTDGPRELAAWYSCADVFVDPTREENFPTTHLEALSCGTPVATYNAGGSGEMLTKDCGVAVAVGDIKGLAEGILKAQTLRREDCLAQAALYGEQERLGDYVELYQRLVFSKGPAGQ